MRPSMPASRTPIKADRPRDADIQSMAIGIKVSSDSRATNTMDPDSGPAMASMTIPADISASYTLSNPTETPELAAKRETAVAIAPVNGVRPVRYTDTIKYGSQRNAINPPYKGISWLCAATKSTANVLEKNRIKPLRTPKSA